MAKEEYAEQTQRDKEKHDQIMAERAEAKYRKNYDMCMDVVNELVNFTCKVGEYRELTNKYGILYYFVYIGAPFHFTFNQNTRWMCTFSLKFQLKYNTSCLPL